MLKLQLSLLFAVLIALSANVLADPVASRQPAPNSVISNRRPTVSATFEAGTKPHQIFVDGLDCTGPAVIKGTTISWTPNYDLDASQHKVRVVGKGLFGIKTEDNWTFTISDQLVEVVEIQPGQNSTVNTPRPTVSARFSGKVVSNRTQLLVDGIDFTSQSKANKNGISWTAPYDLNPGVHKVSVKGVAENGSAIQKDWSFTINQNSGGSQPGNNNNGQLRITNPQPGAVVANRFFVSGTSEPATRVQVIVNPGQANQKVFESYTAPDGGFSVEVRASARQQQIYVVAFDRSNQPRPPVTLQLDVR